MELKTLQNAIQTLVLLEETSAPVISCYLTTGADSLSWRTGLDQRLHQLRYSLYGDARRDFEEAIGCIEAYLISEVQPSTKGVALFARGGEHSFFLPLQFQVPLPTWVVVDSTPNIYHLVELKDTYHRYILMISTTASARILEVNLGAVTEELWRTRPDLRKRVGREWTKEHYQNHLQERTDKFLKETIAVLDGLMRGGGHTHLVLAGPPWQTARLRQVLPKRLATRLIDTLPISGNDEMSDVVAATLARFIEVEELESQAMAEKLHQEILRDGLAVVGTELTLAALQRGQVDVLIIAKAYEPSHGWQCTACATLTVAHAAPPACVKCGTSMFRTVDLKEEMVHLAERMRTKVEVVAHSELLMSYGGVGALLRYRMPEPLASNPIVHIAQSAQSR